MRSIIPSNIEAAPRINPARIQSTVFVPITEAGASMSIDGSCAVFSNNQKKCAPSMDIVNYIIYGSTHLKRVQKALEIKSQFHPAPFILDPADLKFKILTTEELIMLAEYINSQGTSTICLAETAPEKQNPNCILINLDQEK